jgi:signal transduction histidine kinase
VKLTLFRAAQEGLTNIQKHSKATHAWLTLDFSRAGCVRLTIRDNGIGTREDGARGFGLLGLRERAHLVGGVIATRSQPSEGFVLEVEVPV